MSLPPEVIGRIIMARFLSLSLKRYETEINKVKSLRIFRALFPDIITFGVFPRAGVVRLTGKGNPGDFRKEEIDLLERQLRLISTRNRITHMTLLGIIEQQAAYFKTCDPLELVPLSQMRISHWIKDQGYQSIDNSMISRVVNGTFIIMVDGKPVLLKDFFPSPREIYKAHIKGILAEEEMELKSNRLALPYTDEEIKVRVKEVYGLNISRRMTSYCRDQMGIPPFYRRTYDNSYPPTWLQFSPYFPMTLPSIKENVPEMSGIYELSLENTNIEYSLKPSRVIYIGSSKNIRKRLTTHLGGYSKNDDLNALINGGKCFLQVYSLQ